MAKFKLEIITPKKVAYNSEVEMVTAPTSGGVVGILAHHVPLFTRLLEGEVKISNGKDEMFMAIGGGFMEVTHDKVMILVTDAYHADEINEAEVRQAKKRAEEALKAKPEGVALAEAQAMFKRSMIALKILERRRGRSRTVTPIT